MKKFLFYLHVFVSIGLIVAFFVFGSKEQKIKAEESKYCYSAHYVSGVWIETYGEKCFSTQKELDAYKANDESQIDGMKIYVKKLCQKFDKDFSYENYFDYKECTKYLK